MFGGPDFIILGVGRSGTSFMFRSACKQEEVVRCRGNKKEIRFFNQHYSQGIGWYRKFFPHKKGISGEATPSYLFHPQAPKLIKKHFPYVKLAVVFREPVSRLWSHWRHLRKPGGGTKPFTNEWFEDVVQRDYDRIVQPDGSHDLPDHLHKPDQYLGWGCYPVYLMPWLHEFPQSRMKFFLSDHLYGKPQETLTEFFRFIGCTKINVSEALTERAHHKSKFKPKRQMSPEFKKKLQDFYRPYNQHFANMLGIKLPPAWDY